MKTYNSISASDYFFWFMLLIFVSLTLYYISFSLMPEPGYYQQAWRMAHHQPYNFGRFFSVGYTTVLYYAMKLAGQNGMFICQALFYLLTAYLVRKILLTFNFKKPAATVLTLLIALHPYLLLNLKHVNDTTIYIPLFLLLFYSIITIPKISWRKSILYGFSLGLLIMIRPNMLPLLGLFLLSR